MAILLGKYCNSKEAQEAEAYFAAGALWMSRSGDFVDYAMYINVPPEGLTEFARNPEIRRHFAQMPCGMKTGRFHTYKDNAYLVLEIHADAPSLADRFVSESGYTELGLEARVEDTQL